MLRILLLDLDDVLIRQVAYHQSLKECVERISRWCGFGATRLTDEDIAVFESLGVTSEWDSSAICAALLLDRAWSVDPELRLPELPTAPTPADIGWQRPISSRSSARQWTVRSPGP